MINVVFNELLEKKIKDVKKEVFLFFEELHIGSIDKKNFFSNREMFWKTHISEDSEDSDYVLNLIRKNQAKLEEMIEKIEKGKELCIWYDETSPNDMCLLYMIMSSISDCYQKDIFLVKLKKYNVRSDGAIQYINNFNHLYIDDSLFTEHFEHKEKYPALFSQMCKMKWDILQEKNNPLRVIINGELTDVSQDFFDDFLLNKINEIVKSNNSEKTMDIKYLLRRLIEPQECLIENMGENWLISRVRFLISSQAVPLRHS